MSLGNIFYNYMKICITKTLPVSINDNNFHIISSKLSHKQYLIWLLRSSSPGVFLGKCVMKICIKFTGEDPCWSLISIKLLCNFIKIRLRHACSTVNLLHIFRTPFHKNTLEGLLTLAQVFSCEFCEISKNTFFIAHLWWMLLY